MSLQSIQFTRQYLILRRLPELDSAHKEMANQLERPQEFTKGSPLGDTLSLSCEASVGTSGSNN